MLSISVFVFVCIGALAAIFGTIDAAHEASRDEVDQ